MSKFFIISGDSRQARCLADELQLGTNEYTYISSTKDLLGVLGGVYIKYGTYYLRKDLNTIMRTLKDRGISEVTYE